MEEERLQVLELYDTFWFRRHVLFGIPSPASPVPVPEEASALAAMVDTESRRTRGTNRVPLRQKSALRRTLSDEMTLVTSSDSALLASRRPMKLETILSGKETTDVDMDDGELEMSASNPGCGMQKLGVHEIGGGHRERKSRQKERRRASRRTSQDGHSKSLSELEFEELKGLMDLGFTFPEAAESDQRLLSIVPGLRRRVSSEEGVAKEVEEREGEGGVPQEPAIPRPYLSEAWDLMGGGYQERRRSRVHDHLLRHWRVPAAGDGVNMKDHLRSWAHTVASTVR